MLGRRGSTREKGRKGEKAERGKNGKKMKERENGEETEGTKKGKKGGGWRIDLTHFDYRTLAAMSGSSIGLL